MPSDLHVKSDCTQYYTIWQSSGVEFIVAQAPWFETSTTFADIYLPVCTPFERNDCNEPAKPGSTADPAHFFGRIAQFQQQCIPPLFQSMSDLAVYDALSAKLDSIIGSGSSLEASFMEGNTEDMWCQKMYAHSQIQSISGLSYQQFKSRGYWVYPVPSDYMSRVYGPQIDWFASKTSIPNTAGGISTPTGKIEIFSTVLFNQYGFESSTAGIAAIPKYRQSYEGRYSHPLVDKYPLQVISPHPRWRYHGKYDQISWMRELYKVTGPDGHQYEPIYMCQHDATARGLKSGDVVRVFNDRGQVLAGVEVTERITPGTVNLCYGAWNNPVQPGVYGSLDTSGNNEVLEMRAPPRGLQDHEAGCPWNSELAQVEKWTV